MIKFNQEDFHAAQQFLAKVNDNSDAFYKIDSKILLLKIYYELGELSFSNLDSHPMNYVLESVRFNLMQKRSRTMSEALRLSYNNFVNVFSKLLRLKKKFIENDDPKNEIVTKI